MLAKVNAERDHVRVLTPAGPELQPGPGEGALMQAGSCSDTLRVWFLEKSALLLGLPVDAGVQYSVEGFIQCPEASYSWTF